MRILHITTHLDKGGIASYIYSLAMALKKEGHSVEVASSGGQLRDSFIEHGIRCVDIPIRTKKEISPSVALSYFALKKYLKNNRVDVMHAHTRVTQVLGCFLSRRLQIPLVTTCHGFFKPRWHRRVFPCWGEKVIAISSQVKNHLIHDFKVSPSRIYLVHNGIDLKKTREYSGEQIDNIKKEIGIPEGCIVVGTVGRFSSVKGFEYLIEAAREVLKNNPNMVFVIMGQGKEEENLKKLAKDSHLEGKVIFFKPIRDSFEYLPVLDIFVMPSIQEGLGISILEAQSQNIPVIASNVGGISDIISDNVTGLLIPPRDPSEIAKAIIRLSKDKDLCQTMRVNAFNQLKKEFSLEKMVERTKEVYEDAVWHLE